MARHRLRLPLLLPLALAAHAHADVRFYDNAAGNFVWQESFFLNGQLNHGTSLDVTQPPSQSGAQSGWGLQSFSQIFFTSNELVTTSIVGDVPGNITVARGADVLIPNGPWTGYVSPAIAYAAGDMIDASAGGGTWQNDADIDYRTGMITGSLINGRAYVGLKLALPDGTHYGWIDVIDAGYNANPSFTALDWAWETTPDTPIAAGAVPAPAAVIPFALASALIARPRRTTR